MFYRNSDVADLKYVYLFPKVIGIPHLIGPHGYQNCFFSDYANDITGTSIAITAANKNPIGTAKLFDNFFGGKGLEYMNFNLNYAEIDSC